MNYSSPAINLTTPISTILKTNPIRVVVPENEVREYDVSQEVFQSSINDVKQRLKVKLKSGICSSVLIYQLARHQLNLGEKFGQEIHQYHLPSILDIIECQENGTTVNTRPFNRPPLNGLMHIHHNSTSFRARNILNYWKKKSKGKDEVKYQNELLTEIYSDLLKNYDSTIAAQKVLTVFLNRLHYECVFRNINEHTGEWIVFAQRDNINYYLCLATHNDGDQVIYDRLKPCFEELSQLLTI